MLLKSWSRHRPLAAAILFLFVLQTGFSPSVLRGQEEEEKAQGGEVEKGEAEEEAEPADPYAIPEEASIEELFKFIDSMKRIRPPQGGYQAVADTAKKIFPAISEAADKVMGESEDTEEIVKALSEKFLALRILVQYDRSVAAELDNLAEEYANHEKPEIAAVASGFLLNKLASNADEMSLEQAQELAEKSSEYLEKFGLSGSTLRTASGVARALGYSEHPKFAAELYEEMADLCLKSEDESLAEGADGMIASARRLRLLGNPMEVFGQIASGEPFDWADYKGKVVLVDFWASWCGPCMREIPNMKKNLELYGDRGFTIVGINMDRTREQFESCVEQRDITWVNIVPEDEELFGWKAPMATHYGVTGIPTAILVGADGKVVSLQARGRELDRSLEELLGPPELDEKKVDAEAIEETSSADTK